MVVVGERFINKKKLIGAKERGRRQKDSICGCRKLRQDNSSFATNSV